MNSYFKYSLVFIFCFQNYLSFAQSELWGVTSIGGTPNKGCIFKTDINGNNQQVVYEFPYLSPWDAKYTQVVEAPSGKLYFVASHGGTYDGVIMEFDPITGVLDTAYNFQPSPDCRNPYGKMLLASNGKFYGLTYAGGSPSNIEPGGIYEFDPATRTYAFKISLHYTDAYRSYSSFVEEPGTGKLYSTTYYGGNTQKGSIIEYDFNSNTFVTKVFFDGTGTGAFPVGELFRASNGKYYGMTTEGGLNNKGIIYEYDNASNTLTNKMDFDSITNGSRPYGGFVEPVPGILYGLASTGGSLQYGVAFKYNINTSTYTKIHEFDFSVKGYFPYGTLLKATDGFLYGNNYSGPYTYSSGTLFKIDTSNDSLTTIFTFNSKTTGTSSSGSLMQASNGKIYGLTSGGTEYLHGGLYSFDPATSAFSLKCKFYSSPKGSNPTSGLIQGTDGLLYGLANQGGFSNTGAIYSINPFSHDFNTLFSFDLEYGNTTGRWPQGRLCQASNNGKLYGVCSNGGSANNGTIFSFDLTSDYFHMVHECFNNIDGTHPRWNMTEAGNGKLYGVMQASSPLGGVVYEVDPASDNYQQRQDFTAISGMTPNGGLIKTSSGRLFGVSVLVGASDSGAVYEYDYSANTVNRIASFAGGVDGKAPLGSLIEASNGKLYGYAGGGSFNKGIIYECDINAHTINKIYDFDGASNGFDADGSLLESSNGKLYGVTYHGGDSLWGIFFEYDLNTSIFNKKFDFEKVNGAVPIAMKMVEINPTSSVLEIGSSNNFLQVSPSVSTGRFDVHTRGNISFSSLKVTDAAGKEVFKFKAGGISKQLNLSQLSSGIYFIHAVIADGEEVVRIVKE